MTVTYTYLYCSNKDDYGACLYGGKTTDVFENSYNVVFKSDDSILLDLEGNEVSRFRQWIPFK